MNKQEGKKKLNKTVTTNLIHVLFSFFSLLKKETIRQ